MKTILSILLLTIFLTSCKISLDVTGMYTINDSVQQYGENLMLNRDSTFFYVYYKGFESYKDEGIYHVCGRKIKLIYQTSCIDSLKSSRKKYTNMLSYNDSVLVQQFARMRGWDTLKLDKYANYYLNHRPQSMIYRRGKLIFKSNNDIKKVTKIPRTISKSNS